MRPEKHRRSTSRTPSWPRAPVGGDDGTGDGRTYNTALLVFDADSGPYAPRWLMPARGSGRPTRGDRAQPSPYAPRATPNYRGSNRSSGSIAPTLSPAGRDNPDDEILLPSNRREILRGRRGPRQRAETQGLRARCRATTQPAYT